MQSWWPSQTPLEGQPSPTTASNDFDPVLVHYILGYILFFNLEMMSVLIVCNLLVVVTYVYRVCNSQAEPVFTGPDGSSTDDDFTTRIPPKRTQIEPLTLVELNIDTTYNTSGSLSSLPPPAPGGKVWTLQGSVCIPVDVFRACVVISIDPVTPSFYPHRKKV